MKIVISSLVLLLLSISCNYSVQTEQISSERERTPASLEFQASLSETISEGFIQPETFLTDGEINETGEAWIYSIRDKYHIDPEIKEKVQEALTNETFPDKLKHELESIVYDYQLENLTKGSAKAFKKK